MVKQDETSDSWPLLNTQAHSKHRQGRQQERVSFSVSLGVQFVASCGDAVSIQEANKVLE